MAKPKAGSKGKRLSEIQKQQLYADITLGKLSGPELAKKHGVNERTITKYRAKARRKKQEPSVLEMKKALEVGKADAMLLFLMEEMIDAAKDMKTGPDRVTPAKRIKELRETSTAILNIRNALAFTEIPVGAEDYSETDVEIIEYLMTLIPENQRDEIHERITKGAAAVADADAGAGKKDTVQPA